MVGAFQSMVTGSGFVMLGFGIGILDGVICKIGFSFIFMHVFQMGFVGLIWGVRARAFCLRSFARDTFSAAGGGPENC